MIYDLYFLLYQHYNFGNNNDIYIKYKCFEVISKNMKSKSKIYIELLLISKLILINIRI